MTGMKSNKSVMKQKIIFFYKMEREFYIFPLLLALYLEHITARSSYILKMAQRALAVAF